MLKEDTFQSIANNHGFEILNSEKVKEVNGCVWTLKHRVSSARLAYIENDDNNKAFSIAFKTPPANSTGVFHILEHSVLCGSKKYPVKEPFVNLLKNSMQTFLNAMTFPDKTVYPVASTNEKDLLNLMNVYLDAVFNPRIYSAEEIFMQEGWHKEIDTDGSVKFSGVVYNEMQGAMSDPDSVLFDLICKQLYPMSAYSFNSGGDPNEIPSLTYAEFLKTHEKYYCPKNAYITLYGNIDPDVFLKVIDEDYLCPVQEEISKGKRGEGDVGFLHVKGDVKKEVLTKAMPVEPQLTTSAIAFRLGEATDVVINQAFNILLDSTLASSVSPLKSRLLKTGIADEFYASIVEPVSSPALVIAAQGIKNKDALDVLERETLDFFSKWAEGVDKKLIEASINHAEIIMREHNFGTADGVVYSLDILSTWLYDDNRVTDALKFESYFLQMRQMLENGGFEELIKKYILGASAIAKASVVRDGCEDTQIIPIKVSSEEKEAIDKNVKGLQELQSKPDSEENLAKLPYLTQTDIDKKTKKHKYEVCELEDKTVIYHKDLNTSGLAYFNTYFDCSHIPEQDSFYLSLLTLFLGKFDTNDYTAEEIDLKSRELFGRCRFGFCVPNNFSDLKLRFFTVFASCLENKVEEASNLLDSILSSTSFENTERMIQILQMTRVELAQELIVSGHNFARKRARASLSWQGSLEEEISGINFYQHLVRICDNLCDSIPKLQEKLKFLLKAITSKKAYYSTSADENLFKKWNFEKSILGSELSESEKEQQKAPSLWIPTCSNEAFSVKSDVTFAGVCGNLKVTSSSDIHGSWMIASRALSFDYLWNTIRVKGGAYGCGFSINQFGEAAFYTFRDPNVKDSQEIIAKAGDWLRGFSPSEREFQGYVVSSVAEFDKPKKPSALIARGDSQFFSKITEDDRLRLREEVLSTTLKDVNLLSEKVCEVLKNSSVCLIGNKQKLLESQRFDEIKEL